jgi:hypothetical protein
MHETYLRLAQAGRRFFAATGIPVPGFIKGAHRLLVSPGLTRRRSKLDREVEAQARAIERLETMAYIDRLGRRQD